MKKIYLLLLFVFGFTAFGQQKGISYQAVIINPNEIVAPGFNGTSIPLANKAICLSFQIVNSTNQVEYQESQSITTDGYGMVNVVIGTGTSGAGLVSTLEAVAWNQGNKKLVVGVNTDGVCSNYTEISNQVLNYTPYSFYALNADLKDGYVTDVKVAIGINPAKVGLGNVNNTSDANKPVSTATQTALNLKENLSNKSTDIIADAASSTKYPSVKAIKDYVDAQTASAGVADGSITSTKIANGTIVNADVSPTAAIDFSKLNIQKSDIVGLGLTKSDIGLTNVDNTSDANKPVSTATQTALNLKEDKSNKSVTTTLGTSDDLYPTQNAVKTYVDTAIAGATIVDADATTKGKIKLTGDLAGTADLPTVPGLALKANTSDVTTSLGLKEDTSNKSSATGLGISDQLYPTQKAVKTYVDAQVAAATIADADANAKGKIQLAGDLGGTAALPTVPGLALKANTSSLSSVATSGNYNDLINKPSIPSAYALPNATASVLGGVKVGANLNIDANGVLSGASSYSLPTASTSELGGVKVGTGLNITNGVLSASASGVPYTGATQAVDLGAFDLKVNGLTVGRGKNGLEVNVGIGKNVLSNTITGFQGNYLTAVGFEALKNDTWGYFNTAIGSSALYSNTYGIANTAIGSNSLYNNTGANFNTAVGSEALYANTDGISNTAIGKSTGNVNTTGSQNTAIGAEANFGANNLTNATAIGYNAIVTASNSIRLGNTAVSNVKTNGTITAGAVTYPNAHNSITGQVLTTDASGVASWAQPLTRSWTDQPTTVSANQTTFTLTYAPPTSVKIWMFINGVRTNNNAYSVSGTTVTYTPASNGGYAITSSDRIQFDYTY
jgi:hypothetical protein